jgi:hypothetical protein
MKQYDLSKELTVLCIYTIVDQRIGVDITSGNIWIFCCDNIPFAKTNTPHVLMYYILALNV